MNHHLSDEQFAKCAAGHPAIEEQQHLSGCSTCRAELDRFGNSLAQFRTALRNHVEGRLTLQRPLLLQPVGITDAKWRWGLVFATALVLAIIPLVGTKRYSPPPVTVASRNDADANALMSAVDLELSRTIPAPMEPIIALLPMEETSKQSGGVQ